MVRRDALPPIASNASAIPQRFQERRETLKHFSFWDTQSVILIMAAALIIQFLPK